MKVAAIVLNWNGHEYIDDTLESLQLVKVPNGVDLEVIVVDNGSTDGSADYIGQKYSQFTLLRNPINMGFAAGNNEGLRYALAKNVDFIWIINSDIIIGKTCLEEFLKGAQKYPRVGIFGCMIYFAPGYEFYADRYKPAERGSVIWYGGGLIDWKNVLGSHRNVDLVDKNQFDYDTPTDFVTGAVMFIRSGLLQRIGNFDPRYCFYYEENDLCQRAVNAGTQLMFLYAPKAWHKNAQSTGMGSPLQDYFITRNRLLFGTLYAPVRAKIALYREALKLRKTGREWQKKAVNDFFHRRFGAGSFSLK